VAAVVAAVVAGAKEDITMKVQSSITRAVKEVRMHLPADPVRFCTWLPLFIGLLISSHLRAAQGGQVFPTPAEAVKALDQAVNATNRAAFAVLFGPDSDWVANPDSVQGANELAEFTAAFNTTNHLVLDAEGRMILEVGDDDWPFPIPIVKTTGGWSFDAAAGREEILNRRIGRNELEVLRVMRAYVAAQREYASRDRDGDGVLEYAQRLSSSPDKTDGLYWSPELNGETSPLGPLVAEAQGEGYFGKKAGTHTGPQPFHGYYFRILTRQGKQAPGGSYNYIINGNMIGGFAFIAWPADYGNSGVMTFIVNQQGRVYQRDLGPRTERLAPSIKAYNPDRNWTVSPN